MARQPHDIPVIPATLRAAELAMDAIIGAVTHAHFFVLTARMDDSVGALLDQGFEIVRAPRPFYSYEDSEWVTQAELVLNGVGVHLRSRP